jgi:hypothetical protein
MSSSSCPDGCRYDRHSAEAPRFIRTIGDEGVIFEAAGAGAVTRLWMTQGDGISRALDSSIRIRITIDGGAAPVVDLPAAELFAGTTPPFLAPMVLDRGQSGGGFVCLVPIPFRNGCRVSLVGAAEATIWYQVTAMLVDDPTRVVSFTRDLDLGAWRRMLDSPGVDPWPQRGWPTVSGGARMQPGETRRLAELTGPDEITGIVLRAPSARWPEIELRLRFDGRDAVHMPATWFFGVSGPQCLPMSSLLIGAADGDLYSYFPMPFGERATVELELAPWAASELELEYAVRWAGAAPPGDAGSFRAAVIDVPASAPGAAAQLVEITGGGRLVGLALTTGLAEGQGWAFLEGDESIFIDGEAEPSWRGTGVEDFFGGGFYFRGDDRKPHPFRHALHGLTCIGGSPKRPSTSLYRLLITDSPFFSRSLSLAEEGGPSGELPVRWRGVYWSYARPEPPGDPVAGDGTGGAPPADHDGTAPAGASVTAVDELG